MDIDIGKYMEFAASVMPENIPGMPDLSQMGGILKGADKITNAGYCSNGMLAYSIKIPGTLITRVGQMGMMMAMQAPKQTSTQP